MKEENGENRDRIKRADAEKEKLEERRLWTERGRIRWRGVIKMSRRRRKRKRRKTGWRKSRRGCKEEQERMKMGE